MQISKSDFEISLTYGSDKETVAAVLAEFGFASVGAVPEGDRVNVMAKCLKRSRAFNRGARKATDITSYAREFWNRRAPGRDMPKDFDSLAAQIWASYNAPTRPANNGADDDKAAGVD